MRTVLIAVIGLIASTLCGAAEEDAACSVVDHLVTADFQLSQVAQAIAGKRLTVAVIGSASSTLIDPAGAKKAYPAQLEAALAEKLPGVTVKVTTYVRPREGAAEMER